MLPEKFEDVRVGHLIWNSKGGHPAINDPKLIGFVTDIKEDTRQVFIARTPYGRDENYSTVRKYGL